MLSRVQCKQPTATSTADSAYEGYVTDQKKKKIFCSKRCSGGCVGCACAQAREVCSPKCGCKNFDNNKEKIAKAGEDWEVRDLPPKIYPFDKTTSGPLNFLPAELIDPVTIFSKIWGQCYLLIEKATNQKIKQAEEAHNQKQLTRSDGETSKWKPISISIDEIHRYLFASQIMGFNNQPEINNYWNNSSTNMGMFGCNFIKSLISRDIWWKVNNWISFPVDLMILHLNTNFKKYWSCFQHVAIDEILVLFKGRFAGRQHIRGKPNSTGLKFYAMCDERGYCYSFWLYKGKDDPNHQKEAEPPQKKQRTKGDKYCTALCKKGCKGCLCAKNGFPCDPKNCKCINCGNQDSSVYETLKKTSGPIEEDLQEYDEIMEDTDENLELLFQKGNPFFKSSVVVELIADFETQLPKDKNYVFLGDSYFGGYKEVKLLNDRNRLALFTCNANRPSEVFSNRLDRGLTKQGTFNFMTHKTERIVCCSFYDSKLCHFVSNYVGVQPLTSAGRPQLSHVYNIYMNGVDKFDSDLNRYLFDHRKKKWTRCLLHNLFKMALVNSFRVFSSKNPHLQQITFLLKLMAQLFPKCSPVTKDDRPHLIQSTQSQQHCRHCNQTEEKERIARYRCKTCHVFLHPACFAAYHEQIPQ